MAVPVPLTELMHAVLDGEALWMGEAGPASFQETVSRIDRDAPPEGVVTFLFDLLHVDGEDLLDTPLEQRAARLEALPVPVPDTAQSVSESVSQAAGSDD